MGIYQKSINDLRQYIKNFSFNDGNIEELQNKIWEVAQDIVALEEKDLHNALIKAEADIESIVYTIGPDEYNKIMDITNTIENEVSKYYK